MRDPESSQPPQHPALQSRSLALLLAEMEQMLRAQVAQRREDSEAGGPSRDSTALMEEVELRVRTHPKEAIRLSARLGRVRAAHALQMRALPEDALQGLYEDIRAGLNGEGAWLRAGMSEAFLDAPNALVIWRRVAVAACLLLAVGAGYLAPHDEGSSTRASSLGVMELRLVDSGGVDSGGVDSGGVGQPDEGLGAWDVPRTSLPDPDQWAPAPAQAVAHGSRGATRSGAGRVVWQVPRQRSPRQRAPNQRAPNQRAPNQRSPNQRVWRQPAGHRRGQVYIFRQADGSADARRMLDRIRIFPIPGRTLEEGEEN